MTPKQTSIRFSKASVTDNCVFSRSSSFPEDISVARDSQMTASLEYFAVFQGRKISLLDGEGVRKSKRSPRYVLSSVARLLRLLGLVRDFTCSISLFSTYSRIAGSGCGLAARMSSKYWKTCRTLAQGM